mmetsp:Transcript_13751/g.43432  ORF Transcript_13751/g.43432 Transcript_13751/m.43432 type:complete len:240 (-) Transcript_13751:264-983(-)
MRVSMALWAPSLIPERRSCMIPVMTLRLSLAVSPMKPRSSQSSTDMATPLSLTEQRATETRPMRQSVASWSRLFRRLSWVASLFSLSAVRKRAWRSRRASRRSASERPFVLRIVSPSFWSLPLSERSSSSSSSTTSSSASLERHLCLKSRIILASALNLSRFRAFSRSSCAVRKALFAVPPSSSSTKMETSSSTTSSMSRYLNPKRNCRRAVPTLAVPPHDSSESTPDVRTSSLPTRAK